MYIYVIIPINIQSIMDISNFYAYHIRQIFLKTRLPAIDGKPVFRYT